jgi:hypothetical protein
MAAVYFVFTFGLSEDPGVVYTNSCLMFEKHWFKFIGGPATPCFIVVFKAPLSTCLVSMTLSHRHCVLCQASRCAIYVKVSTSNTVCITF